jgi:hypothetical protein
LAASITMYLPDFFTVYILGSGMILPKHRTITSDNTADNFGMLITMLSTRQSMTVIKTS